MTSHSKRICSLRYFFFPPCLSLPLFELLYDARVISRHVDDQGGLCGGKRCGDCYGGRVAIRSGTEIADERCAQNTPGLKISRPVEAESKQVLRVAGSLTVTWPLAGMAMGKVAYRVVPPEEQQQQGGKA